MHSHEQKDFSTVFFSPDSYKIVDCSQMMGERVFGEAFYRRLTKIVRRHYIAFNIAWFVCATFSVLHIFQVLDVSIFWALPMVIAGSMVVILSNLHSPAAVVAEYFLNFDTLFLLWNLLVNACLLGYSVSTSDRASMFLFCLFYFFSFYYVLILDTRSPGFAYFEKKISSFMSKYHANRTNENQQTSDNPSNDGRMNGFSVLNALTKISKIIPEKNDRKIELRRNFAPYSKRLIFLSCLGTAIGILVEGATLLVIHVDYFGLGDRDFIVIGWEKWSIRDILLYTSANIVVFSCNRLFVMVTRPGSPMCYRSGLIRVPLVPEWLHLVESMRNLETKTNHQSLQIAASASASASASKVLEVAQTQSIAAAASNQKGNEWRAENLKTSFFHDQSVVIDTTKIKEAKLAAIVCLDGKQVEYKKEDAPLISKLTSYGPPYVAIFHKFRRLTFVCWIVTYFLSHLVSMQIIDVVELVFSIFCCFAIIDVLLFMANIPLVIYKHTLRSFETMFILGNTVALLIGLMDYFRWQGARVYLGFAMIFLKILQTIFYDMVYVEWKSVSKHIKDIRIDDDFEQSMPFTASLLRRLDRYYVEKGVLSPRSFMQAGQSQKSNTTENMPHSTEMSANERRLYHKLIGIQGVVYYFAMLLFVVVMYLLLISGIMENTQERAIRFLFLERRHLSLFKSAGLNLVIFASKRMYSNWRNPIVSISLTATKQMVPLVSSLVDVMNQLESRDEDEDEKVERQKTHNHKIEMMHDDVCVEMSAASLPVVRNAIRMPSPFQRDIIKSECRIFDSDLHGIVRGDVQVQEIEDGFHGANPNRGSESIPGQSDVC
eukprot:TRINITY_DN1513_c0_g1_i6.p1 TRINITY_DN1513_c0_g1~~TRINITY_DN1513_c0_g1_i6.p1  ORF type:complete len:829 (+),score=192.09 TRINITY_DN1513_c0_g1_i6:122-2608(+)